MLKKTYAVITGIIFLFLAIAHFLRMMFQVDAFIGTWAVPSWVSGTIVIVGLILAMMAFRIVREKKPETTDTSKTSDQSQTQDGQQTQETEQTEKQKPTELPME